VKNYYDILELPVGSDAKAIRASFRRLAKLYHPDVSSVANAEERFMAIQEAYEYLIDDAQRANFNTMWHQSYSNRQDQIRREQVYKLWVEYQKKQQQKSSTHIYDRFQKTEKLSKAWLRVHWVFNVFFLILFALMIILPIYKYAHQDELEYHLRKPFIFYMLPILIGLVFLVSGYYYWFIVKTDRQI